jgi:hypothetical protein
MTGGAGKEALKCWMGPDGLSLQVAAAEHGQGLGARLLGPGFRGGLIGLGSACARAAGAIRERTQVDDGSMAAGSVSPFCARSISIVAGPLGQPPMRSRSHQKKWLASPAAACSLTPFCT